MSLARRPFVQLEILPPGEELGDLAELLARAGLSDSSIKRYIGPALAWKRYCADHGQPMHDAPTITLLRWLDWRVRQSKSPKSALKMSLAAARFAQRGHCVVHNLEAVAYNPTSRVQLDAFMRSVTMNRSTPTRARPLRMDALISFVRKVRTKIPHGKGHRWARSVVLAERDACMAVIGWWGCMRSDDLARLEWSEITVVPEGVELNMKEGKTKQASIRALAERPDCPDICPLRALQRFRAEIACGEPRGLVFGLTTGDHVGRRLKRVFARCGVPRGYTSHSLRAGFATECSSQGITDSLVQAHGDWRSAQQHREYVRLGSLWRDTPTTRLTIREPKEVAAENLTLPDPDPS